MKKPMMMVALALSGLSAVAAPQWELLYDKPGEEGKMVDGATNCQISVTLKTEGDQTVGTVDFETGLVTSEASALKTGSVIKFICDYYDADGEFESCYTLGDPLVYAGDLALSYVELDLRADQSAVFCYRLTDIYENYFWTESVYMTK